MRTLPIAGFLVLTATAAQASTARRLERFDDGHATLKVVLTTKEATAQELVVPIAVPAGMVVTGLSIRIGRDTPMIAQPLLASSARDVYDDVVAQLRDPALLEITRTGTMRLSVYPVTRDTPARVTIELTSMDTEGVARVDRVTSLVAVPDEEDARKARRRGGYADYWPAHRTWRPELVVVVNDPE
jgi:hypothetical protein